MTKFSIFQFPEFLPYLLPDPFTLGSTLGRVAALRMPVPDRTFVIEASGPSTEDSVVGHAWWETGQRKVIRCSERMHFRHSMWEDV